MTHQQTISNIFAFICLVGSIALFAFMLLAFEVDINQLATNLTH